MSRLRAEVLIEYVPCYPSHYLMPRVHAELLIKEAQAAIPASLRPLVETLEAAVSERDSASRCLELLQKAATELRVCVSSA